MTAVRKIHLLIAALVFLNIAVYFGKQMLK